MKLTVAEMVELADTLDSGSARKEFNAYLPDVNRYHKKLREHHAHHLDYFHFEHQHFPNTARFTCDQENVSQMLSQRAYLDTG
jgi:hypothetical protein